MDHGHVDVEVVRLLEALAAGPALEGQVGLGFVLGHVILEGRPLAALEAANLAPAGQGQGQLLVLVGTGSNVSDIETGGGETKGAPPSV